MGFNLRWDKEQEWLTLQGFNDNSKGSARIDVWRLIRFVKKLKEKEDEDKIDDEDQEILDAISDYVELLEDD